MAPSLAPREVEENKEVSRGEHDSEESIVSNDPPEPVSQQGKVDVIPEGGYGWICVACCFLINFNTWGINSSYGIFLSHYLTLNSYPGASPLEYAFIGGLSISMSLAISPVATVCNRKFGTHVSLAVGIFLETAGLLGASWSKQIWQLFLAQGLAFGFGMGFMFVTSVGIIPQWFLKKRSFANSIGAAGSGIGGLVYSLASNAMIQSIGVGWAFRILAIVSCAANVICTILIRDRNKAVGSVQLAFDFRLFKRIEFLLLLGWGVFSMLGYVVLLFSLPNYARTIGLTAKQGSIVGAIMNLGQGESRPPRDTRFSLTHLGIGRPPIGYFSDAAGRINIAGGCTFLAGFLCLAIWINARSYGLLLFYALVGGSVAGTFWAVVGPVSAEVVGLKVIPSAFSVMWIVLVLPTTFSEPIGLQLRQKSGSIYLHAQLFCGFMYIGAAICIWFLRAWKISELEKHSVTAEVREQEIRDDDQVPRERPEMKRHVSRTASVKTATNGLWSWQRV